MNRLSLSPEVFFVLSSLVEDRTGIHYGAEDRDLFADKVGARALESGFGSFLDYYYFLRYDPASGPEFDALVDQLVVNETYFFRETDGLRALVHEIVVPLVRAGGRPRIWSAACSAGDEPLTLAMMLDEAGVLPRVDIVASDISLRARQRAREIGYGGRSFRALPPEARARWFTMEGERGHVVRAIDDAVTWRTANLVDDASIRALGTFDAIVCRNVLIYFADATVLRVVHALSRALRPGGHLLVGTSESLLRFGTMLDCEECGGAFFYRMPR